MVVAIGGCVDDYLETLCAAGRFAPPWVAVQRAYISGWIARRCTCRDIEEFARVIRRKEHIMAHQREALSPRLGVPDKGGERALARSKL